jgi:DNA uptake protein ComE-like DNA-binding protein
MFRLFYGILIIACMASFSCSGSENGAEANSTGKTEMKKKAKKSSSGQENLLDINTATADQLKALPGLSDDEVKNIIAGRPYARKNQLKQKNIISASTYEGIKSAIIAKKAVD